MDNIYSLEDYGYTKTELRPGMIPGRVKEVMRDRYTVMTGNGEVQAVLQGSFIYNAQIKADLPCVGDFVELEYNDSGVSGIARLLPRHSKFSRSDFMGHAVGFVKTVSEQVVAVNFDYVFIVTSLNKDFNIKRISRYLTQARQSGGQPVIILTKADLAEDFTSQIEDIRKSAPEVPVHAVSSHTGLGMEALDEYLKPRKTVVFLGMSGVGKSSLLNALMGQEVMAVKDIREDDSRGRHTTTHRELFMLPSGAMVIDTPGMREMGLFGSDEGVGEAFSHIEELFTKCRFSDCSHGIEPGCAIQAAIKDGTLSRDEWDEYQNHLRETSFVEKRSAFMRDKQARNKSIAMQIKTEKKKGNIRK